MMIGAVSTPPALISCIRSYTDGRHSEPLVAWHTMIRSRSPNSQMRTAASKFDRCGAELRRRCDARNIHAVRVVARRLRALLWGLKPWMKRDPYRQCTRKLKTIARMLGPIRDFDVVRDILLAQLADEAALSAAERHVLDIDIGHARVEVRRDALASICSARYTSQCQKIHDLLADGTLFRKSTRASLLPWKRRILRGVDDLERLMQRAGRRDLHHIRILAKRCRYSLEMLGPDVLPKKHQRMKALQATLGLYCDARMAVKWLQYPKSLHDHALLRRLLLAARIIARKRARAALRSLRK